MRLSKNQIAHLAMTIVRQLEEEGKIIVEDEHRLIEEVEEIITEEFRKEDEIEEEAKRLLQDYIEDIRRSRIEYNEVLKMAKRKLAKKKGVVL